MSDDLTRLGASTRRRYLEYGGTVVGAPRGMCRRRWRCVNGGRGGDGRRDGDGDPYPEIPEAEWLFDRKRVARIIRGDV